MSAQDDLLGHWPFESDLRVRSASELGASAANVAIGSIVGESGRATAAVFDGRTSVIEVAGYPSLQLGNRPFSISLWLHTDAGEGDIVGDLVSCYDPDKRTGFTLSVASLNGVTGSPLVNDRHLHFGIDDGRPDGGWLDCGRPGEAVKIAARRAGERATGSMMVSDAFFPFLDGIDAANEIGVATVVQPGGSVRDQ